MKKLFVVSCCLIVFSTQSQRLVDYVNPFIGTGGHGHTYPGATMPFGMVQLSPDNGVSSWSWSSGYHYTDSSITGFSHTHLSGSNIGDLCDISVMPMVNVTALADKVTSSFTHKQELAKPGYYAVLLKDFDIWAELTTTIRCGFHRYTFPESEQAVIRFDLGFSINTDEPTNCNFKKINDTTFVGFRYSTGWIKDQKIFFAIKLSKPVKSISLYSENALFDTAEVSSKNVKACLSFATKKGEKILMKVGLSTGNIEGALESLNEIPNWDFDKTRIDAENIWERELRKLQIRTDDLSTKQIFYTSLYHTYLSPNRFSDRYGSFKGTNGSISKGKSIYTTQSPWHTYRAANPLLTITQTELVPSIINSYLTFYDQYGLLPVCDMQFNETNYQTGYPAIPIIANAILNNITGFDNKKAFEAMKASAYQKIRGTDLFTQYGFIPHDLANSSVSSTLEYAFEDWCMAHVAKKLGQSKEYKEFLKRSLYWRNSFDRKSGFARPKNSDGKWVAPFDPLYTAKYNEKSGYLHGNAWQQSWFVPHDVYGLINFNGGSKKFMDKLDNLFAMDTAIKGAYISPEITGKMGQYAHGNEPSQHLAYLYNFLAAPEKTADRVREICSTLYSTKPEGLMGNDDGGSISAWYVFSTLGFYPVNPASGEYVLSVPLVEESVIQLPNGNLFRIIVKDASAKNKYIKETFLNGEPYTKSYIKHLDIMNGGILEIILDSKPGKRFGKYIEDLPGKSFK